MTENKQHQSEKVHLLYLTAEQWPTFRPDIVALFGKYLPRFGVTSDLVTERDARLNNAPDAEWGAGKTILCDVPENRAGQYIVKLWHNLKTLMAADANKYDAIQVRDMSVTALFALMAARMKGLRFFYWLSYPQSEGQIARAKARGIKGGMRFWFPLMQGCIGKWLLYRIVLPGADHVFVQSRQMQHDLAAHGIATQRMTPVPMGVDMENAKPDVIIPAEDSRLRGRRVLVYLGTLDPVRQIEKLFDMLAVIRQRIPEAILLIVGDTDDAEHRAWLKSQAENAGVAENVIWLGWLAASDAWSYVCAAELGLSTFPRGYLMDSASPTKTIEYMALGLPVVANDNPDQKQVIEESGAGLCIPLEPEGFANAVIRILLDQPLAEQMADQGRKYVAAKRSYDHVAGMLAAVYQSQMRPAGNSRP